MPRIPIPPISESLELLGRAVAALANDDEPSARSGSVVVAAELARELGFTDVDGELPEPIGLEEA